MASSGDDASSPASYDDFFRSSMPEFEQFPAGDPRQRPLTFPEVWTTIMKNPLARMWAFNMKPPDPYELLLAQENGPFQKSFDIRPPEEDEMFADKLFSALFYEIFAVCHTLADGTYLGFSLNSGLIDVMAAPFAPLNSAFADPSLSVNRLLVMGIDERMVVVEFCWLKSGALTIRHGPYNSLTSSTKSELRLYHSIYAFSPNDAQILAACALVGIGAPDEDFLNAKFQNILLNDYYQIDMHDTRFQESCVFCKSRGHNICDCPMPMRRRCGDEVNEIVPYRIPPGKTAWSEFPNAKSECAKRGVLVFNIKMRPRSPSELIVFSGLFPFNFQIKSGIVGHPTLQQHLQLTGNINPLATAMKSLKRDLFPSAQTRLLANGNGNTNSALLAAAQNPARNTQKRTRRIESVTPPNEEDGNANTIGAANVNHTIGTNANSNANGSGNPTIYNIQVIVQPNGTVSVPERNITGASNEVRLVQDRLAGARGASSRSPVITDVSNTTATGAPSVPNSGSGASGTGSGTGSGKEKKSIRSWDCPECGLVIHNKKSNLNRHIEAIHRKKKNRFQCDADGTCTATFQTAYNLKRHKRNAHGKKKTKAREEERGGSISNSGNSSGGAARSRTASLVVPGGGE